MSFEESTFPKRKIEFADESKVDKPSEQEIQEDTPANHKEEFRKGKELFAILSKIGEQKRFLLNQGESSQKNIDIALSENTIIITESDYQGNNRRWELLADGTVRLQESKPGYSAKNIHAGEIMLKQKTPEVKTDLIFGDEAINELEKIVQIISGQI